MELLVVVHVMEKTSGHEVHVCEREEAIATLSRADHLSFFRTLIQLSQLSTSCRERKEKMLDKGKMRKGGLLTYLLLEREEDVVYRPLRPLFSKKNEGEIVAQFSPGLLLLLYFLTENWTNVRALSIPQSPSSFRAGRVNNKIYWITFFIPNL